MIGKKNRCNFLSKANVLFRICMSLIPLQATCYFTFNKSSISDLYAYFSRERKSRKVSTCYRSKRAFGDLETFVTGELNTRKQINSGYQACIQKIKFILINKIIQHKLINGNDHIILNVFTGIVFLT